MSEYDANKYWKELMKKYPKKVHDTYDRLCSMLLNGQPDHENQLRVRDVLLELFNAGKERKQNDHTT